MDIVLFGIQGSGKGTLGKIIADKYGFQVFETGSELRKLSPGIPVILSSGYSEAQVMEGHHSELPQAFLNKPYQFAALAAAITRVLTNKTAPENVG